MCTDEDICSWPQHPPLRINSTVIQGLRKAVEWVRIGQDSESHIGVQLPGASISNRLRDIGASGLVLGGGVSEASVGTKTTQDPRYSVVEGGRGHAARQFEGEEVMQREIYASGLVL